MVMRITNLKKNKRAAFAAAAAGTALALLLAAGPAGARPDELLRRDAPYRAPAAPAAARDAAAELYVVRPGDTLSGIAREKNVAIEVLVAANGIIERDNIRAGQVLKVPAGCTVHRVQPGETLWDIARTYRVDLKTIIEKNGLSDADHIRDGQELLIPYGEKEVPARGTAYRNAAPLMSWPLYGVVTSPFGMRDGHPHEGIDIAAEEGEPVRAAAPGRVAFAGPRGTYGLAVIIDHGGGVRTLYAHCSEILAGEGDRVEEGEVIARAGSTGRSTGPHLHFEVLTGGVPRDPAAWLPAVRYYG
ncbi:MAG: M23 family metallopeptidase [Firmicutes bacterium]|nr:M23 family metallopeptidase [Bacillota bacterium]